MTDNPSLKTTKTSEGHGLGTVIIREIAEKYDGVCDFYEEDDLFCCNVLLNIKE
ncbi:MAG: GHKL domain-containing protein [Oscillospiraceae bacterium]|nr:GHKL domain-containing protein [Oscillospiraceae bacterium]